MKILVVGSCGSMGKAIFNLASSFSVECYGIDTNLKENTNNQFKCFNCLTKEVAEKIDVVLDFASPSALNGELEFCKKYKRPLVICSTGHNNSELESIKNESSNIPIFMTPNTSKGIYFIESILKKFSGFLKDYDVCLIEKHHKNKKDAPSGTAKKMLSNLKSAQIDASVYSLRGGTCCGEHEIILFGTEEQITIKHTAQSKNLFAINALKICEFMKSQTQNKLYTMEDFINHN